MHQEIIRRDRIVHVLWRRPIKQKRIGEIDRHFVFWIVEEAGNQSKILVYFELLQKSPKHEFLSLETELS